MNPRCEGGRAPAIAALALAVLFLAPVAKKSCESTAEAELAEPAGLEVVGWRAAAMSTRQARHNVRTCGGPVGASGPGVPFDVRFSAGE